MNCRTFIAALALPGILALACTGCGRSISHTGRNDQSDLISIPPAPRPVPMPRTASEESMTNDLIRNGGFEEGGELPWHWQPPNDVTVTSDKAVKHGGAASLCFHLDGKTLVPFSMIQMVQGFKSGTNYKFSIFVKTDGTVENTWAAVQLDVPGTVDKQVLATARTAGTKDWMELTATVPAQAQISNMYVLLYFSESRHQHRGAQGTIWVDDASLVPLP